MARDRQERHDVNDRGGERWRSSCPDVGADGLCFLVAVWPAGGYSDGFRLRPRASSLQYRPTATMVSLKFAAIAAAALSSFTAFAQEPETDGVKVHGQCWVLRKLSC